MDEYYPVFSPDGTSILFVQFEKKIIGEQVIYLDYLWTYNLDKSFLTQYGRGLTPALTPDGKKVVVRRTNKETNNGEIWLIDLEKGQEFIILALKERSFREKSVSPDGKRIAVVSPRFGENIPANLDIYIVNMDGTGLTQLTFHPGHDLCPRWSPDGKYIYFLSQRGSEKGEYNIWRMDVK